MALKDIESLFESPLKYGTVYQYTKWPALFGMIRTKQDGNTCKPYFGIRLYNAAFMNDDEECRLGYQAFLDELKKHKSYFGKKLTEKQFEAIQKRILDRQSKYYLASFAMAEDCLPMWRSYGGEGSGVSIGLDASVIANNGISLKGCIYDPIRITSIVRSLCIHAEEDHDLFTDEYMSLFHDFVYRLSYLAKNRHFDYEKEYRICTYFERFTNNNLASFNNGEKTYAIKFECRGNRIVSFIDIELPIEVVREIWIGPTNNVESSRRSLNMWLESMGLERRIQIKTSTAPFR